MLRLTGWFEYHCDTCRTDSVHFLRCYANNYREKTMALSGDEKADTI